MKNGLAKLVVIPSDWGHMGTLWFTGNFYPRMINNSRPAAGGSSNEVDIQFVKEQVKAFLESI